MFELFYSDFKYINKITPNKHKILASLNPTLQEYTVTIARSLHIIAYIKK